MPFRAKRSTAAPMNATMVLLLGDRKMPRMKKVTQIITSWKCSCGSEFIRQDWAKAHREHLKWFRPGMFVTDDATELLGQIVSIDRKKCHILIKDIGEGFTYNRSPQDLWPILHTHCVVLDNALTQEIKEHQEEWQRRKMAINQANIEAAKK